MTLSLVEKIQALDYLVPQFIRRIVDGDIVWLDSRTQPTEEDVLAAWPASELKLAKESMSEHVNRLRDEHFGEGCKFTVDSVEHVAQTREHDQTLLIGLNIRSKAAIDAGITAPVFKFRTEANDVVLLTPQQAYDLTNTAADYISHVLTASWNLKDTLSAMSVENGNTADDAYGLDIENAPWKPA